MSYPRHTASSAGRVTHRPFTVWRRAFAANVTSSSTIAMSVPTATPPSTATAGVHELEPGEGLIIKPYGTDANDEQIRVAIEIWHPLYDRNETVRGSETIAWVPTTVFVADWTMNAATNAAAAAGPLATTDLFCDLALKLSGTTQLAPSMFHGLSTLEDQEHAVGDANTKASALMAFATYGAKYVQFHIDIDGGTGTAAASGNTLFAVI